MFNKNKQKLEDLTDQLNRIENELRKLEPAKHSSRMTRLVDGVEAQRLMIGELRDELDSIKTQVSQLRHDTTRLTGEVSKTNRRVAARRRTNCKRKLIVRPDVNF